jgi:cytoskeleton protein RodZ
VTTSDLDQGPQADQRLAGQADAAEVPDSPGARLRQTRQVKKLSVDYVASSLHLSRSVVEAIERDDYDRLPSAVFVAGYVRSYARLLGLDPEPLNLSFRRLHPGAEAPPRQVGRSAGGDDESDSGNWLPYLLLLVLVLVIGGGAYLWWTDHPIVEGILAGNGATQPETGTSTGPSDGFEDPTDQPLEPPAQPGRGALSDTTFAPEPTTERMLEEPIPDDRESTLSTPPETTRSTPTRPAGATDATAASEPATGRTPASEPASELDTSGDQPPLPTPEPPETALTAPDASPSEPQTAESTAEPEPDGEAEDSGAPTDSAEAAADPGASAETVELAFTGPCWVDIRDATGEVLLFGEMSRGDSQVLGGEPPYSLVLGNASAVEVTVGDKAYDIGRHSRGNVARFELDPAEVETTAAATETE